MLSIQSKLLFWLILCIVVATSCSGLISYRKSLKATDQLFDYLLQELATSLPAHLDTKTVYQRDSLNKHIVVQIWNRKQHLIYSSNPEWQLPRYQQQGFQTVAALGTSWRIYTENRRSNYIQVAYQTVVVNELATDLALQAILPFAFIIPIVLLLVAFIINQSLQPFRTTAQALAQRTPDQLEALPTQDLPKELYVISSAINDLLVRLAKALNTQRAFVADAAHELRSPLTALKLQLQLTERIQAEPQRSQALNKLHERLNRAIHLVEQMLLLARQEATLEPATRQLSSIQTLVMQAVQSQQSFAQQQHIRLETHLEANEITLAVNASSIEMMLRNLIENALKHTPAGGVVRVSVHNEFDAITLRVLDTGCGIEPAERKHVFGRFYRAANNQHSGTGLGLAIVKSIAEQHHASIFLNDSPLGQGLLVEVRLPKNINKI
jgi:two-component system OmpR family sensor kinase